MRAIIIRNYGGAENLVIGEYPDPEPQPGHILVEVRAFGLNRAEIYFREGLWGDVAEISGIECAGIVRHDPEGNLRTGQPVIALMGGMGRSINGSYAELVSVPATNVVAIENPLSWEALAALPESYATAWTSLKRNLALESGEHVLIRGGTSALGQAAINIATAQGAHVLATTRRPERFATLERLGAEPLLERHDLSTTIRERHPGGIDAVLDIVGTGTIPDSLAMTRPGGRVCLVGFLGGAAPLAEFDPLTQMPSGVQFSFFASAFTFGNRDYPLSSIPFQEIIDRAHKGIYKARPARVFDFEQIADAHRFMESDAANGKIVIRVQAPA